MKELRLGDMTASFDKTGAIIFKDSKDLVLCWINFIGVHALKEYIEEWIKENGIPDVVIRIKEKTK